MKKVHSGKKRSAKTRELKITKSTPTKEIIQSAERERPLDATTADTPIYQTH